MKTKCPIRKIMLPVDGSKNSDRAVRFAGYLGAALGKNLSKMELLRVITGGFISRHLTYIDLMEDVLKETDAFKKIREEHFDVNIRPVLDASEKALRRIGVKSDIEKVAVQGDAANRIAEMADKKKCSTIIMARRGLSEIKGFLLGSVTSKVVHSAKNQTVYIVGHNIREDVKCPVPDMLIPIDGSKYSIKGAEHAACLAAQLSSVKKIALLRVINLATVMGRLQGGVEPLEEAGKIFEEAKKVFLKAGIPEDIIQPLIKVGSPAEEILKEAEKGDYSLIVIGRKGRAAVRDLVLGSVSSIVLERCKNPTVAIVSSG